MNRTVTRGEPRPGLNSDVRFSINLEGQDVNAAAVRLRLQFPGAELTFIQDDLLSLDRGDYEGDWRAITATQVAKVVQEEPDLLHIVLAPDPCFIDAIQMRVNVELNGEQIKAVAALGLMVYRMDEPPGYGLLYRLTPYAGNGWPSREEIAQALDATHSEPINPEVW